MPRDQSTLAVRSAGQANYERAWNRHVVLLDAWYDRGSIYPPIGLIGQRLVARLGQPFVTENGPSAGGNLGTEAVVRAPPDVLTGVKLVSVRYCGSPQAVTDLLGATRIMASAASPSCCARRERQCRRAANKGDELAPSDAEHGSLPGKPDRSESRRGVVSPSCARPKP
jgi:hypothetical protein